MRFFTMNIETGKTAPFVKFTPGDPSLHLCTSAFPETWHIPPRTLNTERDPTPNS
jgi:hypothetical protein